MKRFPNGIAAPPFYQHRAPDVPPGVRIERRRASPRQRPQIIGGEPEDAALHDAARGDLAGSVVLARAASGVRRLRRARSRSVPTACRSRSVLDVARWIRDELDTLGADRACRRRPAPTACTSTFRCRRARRTKPGCSSARSSRPSSRRSIRRRRRSSARVQARAASASTSTTCRTSSARRSRRAYSARASDYAGVSTPLTWKEVDEGFDRKRSRSQRPRRASQGRRSVGEAAEVERRRPEEGGKSDNRKQRESTDESEIVRS